MFNVKIELGDFKFKLSGELGKLPDININGKTMTLQELGNAISEVGKEIDDAKVASDKKVTDPKPKAKTVVKPDFSSIDTNLDALFAELDNNLSDFLASTDTTVDGIFGNVEEAIKGFDSLKAKAAKLKTKAEAAKEAKAQVPEPKKDVIQYRFEVQLEDGTWLKFNNANEAGNAIPEYIIKPTNHKFYYNGELVTPSKFLEYWTTSLMVK